MEPDEGPTMVGQRPLCVLEFYSGVGGMHYALREAGVEHEVLHALDMNEVANAVYEHNFPGTPINTTDIGRLGESWLDRQNADLWTMSPPCQPYTRGGLQKGSTDPRSSSLLFLIDALGKMNNPPRYILLENVKGFELSDTFGALLEVLASRRYNVQNFLLTPQQFAVPNARVRFYCLAQRANATPASGVNKHISGTIPHVNEALSNRQIEEFLDWQEEERRQYSVPSWFLRSLTRGYRFDIVTRYDTESTCFTKNYAKNFKGSGPLFLPTRSNPSKEEIASYDTMALQQCGLRFFTPREIANLLCFPSNFSFPASVSVKQAYRLLGNSINVHVVALLFRHLLSSPGSD